MLACCLGHLSQHHINYLCMLTMPDMHLIQPINCSCKPGSQEEQPKTGSTIDEKAYEQQVVLGEQPVTLNEDVTLGEDMPDGWHFMESNSEILDEVRVRSFVYCVQYTLTSLHYKVLWI